jgi:alcohol dehydrogenase
MGLLPDNIDYQSTTRLVSGENSLNQLGDLVIDITRGKVLIVTDAGIKSSGHVERAVEVLKAKGIDVAVFDQVKENPTTREVDACVEFARTVHPELIVGLGGGSSMDTAKGCNFIYTNGGCMQDYWGIGKASKEMLPLIAIPTTAGTGSECQSFALIADPDSHRKMACGDSKAAPVISILDPVLTVTQPYNVSAATGIDAIAHALESAVTKKRNTVSAHYSKEAFKRVIHGISKVLDFPENLEARAEMQIGAAYAGIAIENSMLGAAHASANPLTARLGITHGFAVGMMLPSVVRFNSVDEASKKIYHHLAVESKLVNKDSDQEAAVNAILKQLKILLEKVAAPYEAVKSQLNANLMKSLAEDSQKEWTATFNPREMTSDHFADLYRYTFNM